MFDASKSMAQSQASAPYASALNSAVPKAKQKPEPEAAPMTPNVLNGQHSQSHLQATPVGTAQAATDFLDQIVNPWAAPSLEEVAAGVSIVKYREGPAVEAIQQRLLSLGYELEPSGVLDKACLEAVGQLHTEFELPFDHQVDAQTLQALEQAETLKAKHEAYAQKQEAAVERLESLKPHEINALARKDKTAFFEALMPAALESERRYGVPAAMTLAQASLESDWAAHPIGGYNVFGIKGQGPAGSVNLRTREVLKGKEVFINDHFARYHNFYEAVSEHGKHYNNGKYDEALEAFAQHGDPKEFVDLVAPIYATAPNYAWAIKKRFDDYQLLEMVQTAKQIN